jgi:hypothetical protein
MISDHELWAAANMVVARHGDTAPIFVAERLGQCALDGDDEGIRVWKAIAARLSDIMLTAKSGVTH